MHTLDHVGVSCRACLPAGNAPPSSNGNLNPCHSQSCLQAEARNPNVPMRTLVSAHMTAWAAGSAYPVAKIRSSLGQAGLHLDSLLPVPLVVRKFNLVFAA